MNPRRRRHARGRRRAREVASWVARLLTARGATGFLRQGAELQALVMSQMDAIAAAARVARAAGLRGGIPIAIYTRFDLEAIRRRL